MTYRSPENLIRSIMAKSAGITLNESTDQTTHMNPAQKTPEAERLTNALNILKTYGCESAKIEGNTLSVNAAEIGTASNVLERAMAHGLIDVRPELSSPEALPMPEPHVPAPVETPAASVQKEENVSEAKTMFTVEKGATRVKLGDNHERVWTHNGHDLYRSKDNPKEHMLLRKDHSVHSMFEGHTDDVKHMIKSAGLPALRKGLKEESEYTTHQIDEISDATKKDYIKAAARSMTNHSDAEDSYREMAYKFKDPKHVNAASDKASKHADKIEKRMKGIVKASKGLKEEEQIDELSTETLHKVANVARKKGRKDVLDAAIKANKRKRAQPDYKFAGEEAVDEITAQLDELSLASMTSYTKMANKPMSPLDKKIDRRRVGLQLAKKKIGKAISKAMFGEEVTPMNMLKRVRNLHESKGRLMATLNSDCGNHKAKIYKDPEWNEHRVEFHINGKHHEPADYHTSDYEDAHGTAKLELKRMTKLNGALKESTEEEILELVEYFDQIDEISKNLLGRYLVKADRQINRELDASNAGKIDLHRDEHDSHFRRREGFGVAASKITGKAEPTHDGFPAEKPYSGGAAVNKGPGKEGERKPKIKATGTMDSKTKKKVNSLFAKEHPLVKEDEQIDEISRAALTNYVDHALTSVHNSGFKSGQEYPHNIKGSAEHAIKSLNRQFGIKKAVQKLSKRAKVNATEEVENVDEGLSSHMKKKGYGIADTSTYHNTGDSGRGYEVPGKDVRVGPKRSAAYHNNGVQGGLPVGPETTDVRKAKKYARLHKIGKIAEGEEVAKEGDSPFLIEANLKEVHKKLEHHGYKKFGDSDRIDHREILTTYHHPEHGHLVSINHTEHGRVNSASAMKCTNSKTGEMAPKWGEDHPAVEHALRELGHKSYIGFKEEVELTELSNKLRKVGSYSDRYGNKFTMHTSNEDSNHHFLVHNGSVVDYHHGSAIDFHRQVRKDGLSGALHEEQLDELSRKTLASYIDTAKHDISAHAGWSGYEARKEYEIKAKKPTKARQYHDHKLTNRLVGVGRATEKLAKEEAEQIDELSKETLAKYVRKASHKMGVAMADHALAVDDKARSQVKGRTTQARYAGQNMRSAAHQYNKRYKGVNMAIDRLAKEEVEHINETPMPSSVIKHKQRLGDMSDKDLAERYKKMSAERNKPAEEIARQEAWRHGYGKMSSHYWNRIKKHISEEIINELSTSTLTNYAIKAAASKNDHMAKGANTFAKSNALRGEKEVREKLQKVAQTHQRKAWNRHLGAKRAVDKLTKKPETAGACEEVQIDEVSKSLLKRYINKAKASADSHDEISDMYKGAAKHQHDGMDNLSLKHMWKSENRRQNIDKAKAKLAKEEVEQVDEVSDKLARSYISKASSDLVARRHGVVNAKGDYISGTSLLRRAREKRDHGNSEKERTEGARELKTHQRKIRNRTKGIDRAIDRTTDS